jgi:hypothetical protein
VERWRSDCGCRISHDPPTSQAWRAPLRDALSWFTAECHALYARESVTVLRDPVAALDGYGAVLGAGVEGVRAYAASVARSEAGADGVVRAAELLELERGALRSLTSCAWFFDDLGGIETLQVLRYAAWAIGLAGTDAARLEAGLLARLAPARSNLRTLGSGRDLYLALARPALPPLVRIAAGLAAARQLAPAAAATAAWMIEGPDDQLRLTNRRTGRQTVLSMALTVSDLDVAAIVHSALSDEPLALALGDLPERQREAIASVLRGRLLESLLDPEERAALARGEALRPVVRHALVRRVRELAASRTPERERAVGLLLTALDQLGQTVPFEAQTLFYAVWRGAPGPDAGLDQLARRMGFVTP